MTEHIWYLSYGSNLLRERFLTYLTGSDENSEFGAHPPAPSTALPAEERWMWIDHPLYFAGVSRRWTGSPAFVSLTSNPANRSVAHGYLIGRDQFSHLVAVENVVESIDVGAAETLAIGEWAQLAVDRQGESFRGKYDALLRLPDIDGRPAFTLTSSIVREPGGPSSRYLSTVRRGLLSAAVDLDVDAYLDAAIGRSTELTSTHRGSSSTAARCNPTTEKQ
ncbi:putative uncharacterized protein [Rhodococcus sp. AW25M09]|uniref:hypothetical protein n=1 Tax=Rhodococcus sp. AW25M09 TaxID=1268303 RepID=UPI0002ABDED9|nr:hypothetical protein [Rhodococcus sp. AW25M09]CCQ15548.1 putative uncharacterized protein [Rhodococcus sp. AW25M09]